MSRRRSAKTALARVATVDDFPFNGGLRAYARQASAQMVGTMLLDLIGVHTLPPLERGTDAAAFSEGCAVWFRSQLRLRREGAQLSQLALAQRVGVQRAAITHLESGMSKPGFAMLCMLAHALNCPVGALVEPTGTVKP
jgi:DNA-binding XRE family transcriptional regulator